MIAIFKLKASRFIPTSSLLLSIWSFSALADGQLLNLNNILDLLQEHNPTIAGANARRAGAEAAMTTARAYPNPELDLAGGLSTGLGPGALSGSNQMAYMAQPLDLPFVREARRQVAEAGIESAEQANRAVWLMVYAKTRQTFYEILRREAELAISQDNERILAQIRDKVTLKVEVGEAARYEMVKAEAELLNAVKLRSMATVQVEDAKSALRALFAGALPYNFSVEGELPVQRVLPNLESMRARVLEVQPLLHHVRAEVQKARRQVHLEQQMRYPLPTLKAGVESDPGLESWRIGIALPLPLWNQRQGPIAEAEAQLRHSEADAKQQELTLIRELENAYNRYLIADGQVKTFETGLLKQAENTLRVAEAAYRLGERGILDFLDAQRSYRSVRNDYINARFDRQNALIDLEKLSAEEIQG